MFLLVFTASAGAYSGGTGELNNPYQIADACDLLELAANTSDCSKCFILTADINLHGQNFTTAIIAPDGWFFTGKFDGNNHTISHFTISGGSNGDLGLFRWVSDGGEVKNLGITDCNIVGTGGVGGVGGLTGYNNGNISNCYSIASVSGYSAVGGLTGYNNGNISNCYSIASVNGYMWVGGLVGHGGFKGSISDCCSTANVSGTYYLGGLVGWNEGPVSYCYADSNINGIDSVGGLLGGNGYYIESNISYCHSMGTVGGVKRVGGLVGECFTHSFISHCYSTAAVTGSSDSNYVGGLVGIGNTSSGASIAYCYSTGPVTGTYRVGGLVGENYHSSVANSYSTSSVSGLSGSRYVAGLVGYIDGGYIHKCYSSGPVSAVPGSQDIAGLIAYTTYIGGDALSKSYWDKQTSGQTTSTGGTAKTTAEMKTLSTFASAGGGTEGGWDFVQTWYIEENQSYPLLRTYLAGDINHDGEVDFYDFDIFASQWLKGTN